MLIICPANTKAASTPIKGTAFSSKAADTRRKPIATKEPLTTSRETHVGGVKKPSGICMGSAAGGGRRGLYDDRADIRLTDLLGALVGRVADRFVVDGKAVGVFAGLERRGVSPDSARFLVHRFRTPARE